MQQHAVKPTASYPVGQHLSRSPGDARGISLVSPSPSGHGGRCFDERGVQENFRTC